jgi:hypothetical protein
MRIDQTLVAGAAAFFILAASQLSQAQQPPTLDEVVEGMGRMEKLLFESKSLLIRYSRTQSQKVVKSAAAGALLPAEWSLAYRGKKWFIQRRFTEPMTSAKLLVPAEPKTEAIADRFYINWDQHDREATLDMIDVNRGGDIYGGLYYTRNLSLDAAKFIAKAESLDLSALRKRYPDEAGLPFLPDYLSENKSNYHVQEIPDTVDGLLCWIVEWPGVDKFWVDPSHGYAVPRRIYSWAPGKPTRYEFHLRDYQEMKPGLWLPSLQKEIRYASITSDKTALWGHVTSWAEYKLLAAEFDNVPDTLFDIKLPPGTTVHDDYRKFTYKVPGNREEPFATAIAAAQAGNDGHSQVWLWLALVAAIALFAGLVYRRRLAAAR